MKVIVILITFFISLVNAYSVFSIIDEKDHYQAKPYTKKLDNNMYALIGAHPPYAAIFLRKHPKLIYLATKHSNEITTNSFNLIKISIEKFKPDLIILEGFRSSDGYSSQKIVKEIEKNNCQSKLYSTCNEIIYAASLANKKHIKFIGGEPDDPLIFKILERSGYPVKDIIFFYFSRQVPQLYRERKIKTLGDLEPYFLSFSKTLAEKSQTSFSDYKKWILIHLKKFDFSMLINSNNTAPISNGHFLQKISSVVGLIRDKHILNLIVESSNEFDKILVVYGASHFSTQYSTLSKVFGQAEFFIDTAKLKYYFEH